MARRGDRAADAARYFNIAESTMSRWLTGSVVPGYEHEDAVAEYTRLGRDEVFATLDRDRRERAWEQDAPR